MTSSFPPGAESRGSQQQSQGSHRAQGSTQDRTALELFTELMECFRTGKLDAIDDLCTQDLRFTVPGYTNVSPAEAKRIISMWRGAFSDYGQQRADLSAFTTEDGRKASIRDSHTLTHDGEFQLPDGQTMQGTGRQVVIHGSYNVLAPEGRIQKIDLIFDRYALFQQLRGESPQHGQAYGAGRNSTQASDMSEQYGGVQRTSDSSDTERTQQ